MTYLLLIFPIIAIAWSLFALVRFRTAVDTSTRQRFCGIILLSLMMIVGIPAKGARIENTLNWIAAALGAAGIVLLVVGERRREQG